MDVVGALMILVRRQIMARQLSTCTANDTMYINMSAIYVGVFSSHQVLTLWGTVLVLCIGRVESALSVMASYSGVAW